MYSQKLCMTTRVSGQIHCRPTLAAGAGVELADLMTPPRLVPATQTVTQLLEGLKKTGRHLALVTDQAGAVVGLVFGGKPRARPG